MAADDVSGGWSLPERLSRAEALLCVDYFGAWRTLICSMGSFSLGLCSFVSSGAAGTGSNA